MRRQRAPEADIAREILRRVAETIGHATVLGVKVPISATANSCATGIRAVRIGLWIAGVIPGPIPAPFPNIAGHVVKPVAIRSKRPNGTGIRRDSVVECRVEASGRAEIVRITAVAEIIRIAVSDGVDI